MKCTSKTMIFGSLILVVCSSFIFFTGQYNFPDKREFVCIYINSSSTIFRTDDKFLSIALDSSFMRCLFHKLNESEWAKLTELSSLLSPAYIRLGGTEADLVIFNINELEYLPRKVNDTLLCNFLPNETLIITGQDWTRINDFVNKSKLTFIFDLNVLLRNEIKWNSSNAEELIRFSEEKRFPLNFQLGNEPNSFKHVFNVSVSGKNLANDFEHLKDILNSFTIYKDAKLIGPDVTNPRVSLAIPSLYYLREFLSYTNSVDAVSWHHYYFNGRTAHLKDFINPKIFDSLSTQIHEIVNVVQQFSPGLPIWISETSSAYGSGAPGLSDRYVASFLWLDKLGLSASKGMSVIIRQSLLQGHYALLDADLIPSPDFWISFFYKNLVGNQVMSIKKEEEVSENLRFYCHCSLLNSKTNGSIVVFGMNLSNSSEKIILSGINFDYPIRSFTFTPENANLTSKSIFLNGKKLVYNKSTIYDLLKNPQEVKFPLFMPPYAIVFWIFQEVTKSVCS